MTRFSPGCWEEEERTTFTDAGEILYLMDPGVMLEQLHADECFATNTAGEARLSWWETNN